MQIQITRTLIWVTNDARYYLATSACKLERQALSIWPFQIQRVRRRHYRPHGCATPPRYLFQRLKSNFTRESRNKSVKINRRCLFSSEKLKSLSETMGSKMIFMNKSIWEQIETALRVSFLAKRSGKNLSTSLSVWTNEKTRFPRMHQSEEREKRGKLWQFWHLVEPSRQSPTGNWWCSQYECKISSFW